MPYDGNGNYVRAHNWVADAANALDINATEMDAEDNGFAAALTNAVTRDGQGKMGVDFLPNADNTLNLGSGALRWLSINGTPIAQIIPTQQGIGGLLNPRTAAEIAASVTPTNFQFAPGPYIDARRYGTDPTGVLDSTAAIQAAISVAQASTNGATIILAPGVYKVTSQLLISANRVRLIGSGMYATQILFAPTANGICLKLANGVTTINQCSLSDFTIYSNDSSFTKTAIDITDGSGCYYERIVIAGSVVANGAGFWSGGGSIGIRTHGRDTSGFRDITAFCDKPLVISTNPHGSISIDHHNFHNCFLGGNGNPIVTIEAGVTLTQVSFTGYQAWVLGTGGLSWIDATSPGSSNGLTIENLRYENSTDATKYIAQVDVTSPLQMFVIRSGQGSSCKGFHFRNVAQVTIDSFFYSSTSLEALNADGTCGQIVLRNAVFNTGSTATITGLMVVQGDPTSITQPVPATGLLMPSGTFYQETVDETMSGAATALAAGATIAVGSGSQLGTITITDDTTGVVGMFFLKGNNHATVLGPVSDAGFFSVTSGNANTINCYWNAGSSQYVVQNGYGVSKTVRVSGKIGKT